ncbi:MAG: SemiSWEET transporter [Candidatus Nealsonbacteria bacterium]|nr:SemiSWEET transporter [Candidatus Nealsonbacteria bacterium]
MNWITLLGFLAAILTTSSFVPQVIKTVKTKTTKDISLPMYAIITAGSLLWLIYGLMIKNLPIMIANLISLCLIITVLVFKIRHG